MVEVSWYALMAVPLLLAAVVYLICLCLVERPPPLTLAGSHAFITGASSGVGLSTALRLLPLGVHCTLIARNRQRLSEAEARVRSAAAHSPAKLLAISADVCDLAQTQAAIQRAQAEVGPISLFIHCAGSAAPGYFEELPPSVHTAQYNLHYLGAVNCLHSLVPSLKRQRSSRVVLVASMGGLSGIFGYTAYSASKFALRALAESLHMEVAPYGCYVSLICPPDLDTPGFAEENKRKPVECAEISGTLGLHSPDAIAQDIESVLRRWRFLSSVGFDGRALTLLTSGTSPVSSAWTLTVEFFSMGVLRLVSAMYKVQYNAIVRRIKQKREKGQVRPIGKQQ